MPRRFPDRELDYREHPECYRIGRGEQGVLTVEPYKSELLSLWSMGMARKYPQMGHTRSRRYARHRSGRKFGPSGKELPEVRDAQKRQAAEIFLAVWKLAREDARYLELKELHQKRVSRIRKDRSFTPQ